MLNTTWENNPRKLCEYVNKKKGGGLRLNHVDYYYIYFFSSVGYKKNRRLTTKHFDQYTRIVFWRILDSVMYDVVDSLWLDDALALAALHFRFVLQRKSPI